MSVDLTLQSTVIPYPTQGDSAGWGEAATLWATLVTNLLSIQFSGSSISPTESIILDNTSGSVSGLIFDNTIVRSFEVNYDILRTDGVATVAEIATVTTVADVAGSLGGLYFTLNSAEDRTRYYVWIDVDNGSSDPTPAGLTGIEVDISAGNTADQVATAIQTAVDLIGDFGASVGTNIVTITNAANGQTTDLGAFVNNTGFTLAVTTQGAPNVQKESGIIIGCVDTEGPGTYWNYSMGPISGDAGVELDINESTGQITYVSDTMGGGSYSGTIKFKSTTIEQ